MLPSEVRRMILDDHEWLRTQLAEVDDLARRVLEGESGLVERLREIGTTLQTRFLEHLDLEDRHLLPALRDADAWGEERASRVGTRIGKGSTAPAATCCSDGAAAAAAAAFCCCRPC